MGTNPTYEIIKKTVLSYLPDARILLFGSRARGTEGRGSDYDLLVITPNQFAPRESINWRSTLNKALVNAIYAPVDVLMFSEAEILEKKEWPGHIVRSAVKEGVTL